MIDEIFGFAKSDDNKKDLKDRTLVVRQHRCPQNHPCPAIKVCPVGALTQNGYAAPTVDNEKCIKCGKCARYCAMGALVME